jgi:hypothetical protein
MRIHDLNYLEATNATVFGGDDLTFFDFGSDVPASPVGNYNSMATSFAEIVADQGGVVLAQGATTIGNAVATASVNAGSLPIVQAWLPIATNFFSMFDTWF